MSSTACKATLLVFQSALQMGLAKWGSSLMVGWAYSLQVHGLQ